MAITVDAMLGADTMPPSGVAIDFAETARRVRASTVEVRSRDRAGGTGAGIIWHAGGLIVTNAHVARDASAIVELASGHALRAWVIARDPRRDLAALAIAVPHELSLAAAELGDARALRVGQLVIAVGSPFGHTGAVAAGIVHGVARDARAPGARWIRADVRLAPGNSGGPLADAAGRVLGVNTMIVGGLALAVPAHVVDRFLAAAGALAA